MSSNNGHTDTDGMSLAKLTERETALRRIISSLRVGVVVIHVKTHTIIGANLLAQRLMQVYEPDILGKCCHDIMCPEPKGQCPVTDLGKKITDIDTILLSADGPPTPIRKTEMPISWGGEDYLVVSFLDLTDEKEAERRHDALEEHLYRAERLEYLGVLAGGVAHNLNNVLGPVVALPDVLESTIERVATGSEDALAEARSELQWIRSASQRAAAVLNDLLTMGSRSNIDREPVDMKNVVKALISSKTCVDLQAAYPDVTIDCNTSERSLLVRGSANHLQRAIGNLIINAFQSIDGSGTVTISVGETHLDYPRPAYEIIPAGHYSLLRIADTGCGIEPDGLNRMFEPFYTTKAADERSGTGLGLSVARGIIKDHGGFFHVESSVGDGTGVNIYLPLVDDTLDDGAGEAKAAAAEGGGERLLCVDDEDMQRRLVHMGLEPRGYIITDVPNGQEAVAFFERTHQAGQSSPFDVVLLDMIMEVGFDGLVTLEKILELYPDQKVIIVSGHAPDRRGEAATALGAGWVSKPYTFSTLDTAIRERLGTPNSRR